MKVWGLAATLGFGILAFVLGQALGVTALTAFRAFDPQHVDYDGTAIAIVTLIANPVQVVTLVLAVRMTGSDAFAYFGLDMPRRRDIAIAVAALAAVVVLGDALTVALGRELVPAFQLEIHRSARAAGTLPFLWLAIVFAAPVGEELLFRGFLFRGLIHSPRDSLPGILVIALIWSLLHIQYDLFGASLVFALGVMFGYVRLYSGSTTLVILLHVLLNAESVAETLIVLGWV
jgi:uncharacterized protein